MKLTHDERTRVRLWLEKDPNAEDSGKTLELDDGRTFGRVTQYFGGTTWKVRIAYDLETSYPILMSSPIPGNQDSKKQAKTKYPMVPKLPAPEVAPKKSVGNKSAFASAVDWEMKQIKQGLLLQETDAIIKKIYPAQWGLPSGVYKKAVKGTKALYGYYDTLYVVPGQTFTGSYFYGKLVQYSTPEGYQWVEAAGQDLYTLVKK